MPRLQKHVLPRCIASFLALSFAPAFANHRQDLCTYLLMHDLKQSSELKVVPSSTEVLYEGFGAGKYLSDVNLTLKTTDNIELISKILAIHGDAAELQQKIGTFLLEAPDQPIPLRELLPPFPRDAVGLYAKENGPNCFNCTLKFHEPGMRLRYVGPLEMRFHLFAKFRKLSAGDELQFGDVIVLYQGLSLEHAMIYVDDQIVFHKNNVESHTPYVFETFYHAVDQYSRRPSFKIAFYRHARFGKEKRREEDFSHLLQDTRLWEGLSGEPSKRYGLLQELLFMRQMNGDLWTKQKGPEIYGASFERLSNESVQINPEGTR